MEIPTLNIHHLQLLIGRLPGSASSYRWIILKANISALTLF